MILILSIYIVHISRYYSISYSCINKLSPFCIWSYWGCSVLFLYQASWKLVHAGIIIVISWWMQGQKNYCSYTKLPLSCPYSWTSSFFVTHVYSHLHLACTGLHDNESSGISKNTYGPKQACTHLSFMSSLLIVWHAL